MRFFDHLAVAYFFGPPCRVLQWRRERVSRVLRPTHSLSRRHCNEASRWKRPKFDPSPRRKPLNRYSVTKIGMRDFVLGGAQHAKFYSDRFRGFCSSNTWFCWAFCCDYFRFLGFFNMATVYTHERIFMRNTPEDIVLRKEVHFGDPSDYI